MSNQLCISSHFLPPISWQDRNGCHVVGAHINKSDERSGLMEPFHAAMSYEALCTCNSCYTCGTQLRQNFSWLEAIQVTDVSLQS